MNPNTEEARRLAGVLRKVIPYEGNEWDLDEAARQLCALADEVERLEARIEELETDRAPMIDCLAGKLTSYDQIFGYLCKLEMENEAMSLVIKATTETLKEPTDTKEPTP